MSLALTVPVFAAPPDARTPSAVDKLVRKAAGRPDHNDRSTDGDAEASRAGTSTHTM